MALDFVVDVFVLGEWGKMGREIGCTESEERRLSGGKGLENGGDAERILQPLRKIKGIYWSYFFDQVI